MMTHRIVSFLQRKCMGHFLIDSTGRVEEWEDHPGWTYEDGRPTPMSSFIVVSEGQGYEVSVRPIELAS